ncbi:MAG: UDP binding domain-containing protein, partial [Vagococcus salmoninarum]
NVPDYRMSPVPKLIKALASYNFSCEVYDDLLTEMTSESGEVIPVKKVNYPDLNAADMTLLLVDHDYLDYRQLVTHSQLLIDTKNSCRDINDSRKITL